MLAVAGCSSGTEPMEGQPNFVLLLVDDLDWQLVPHLSRLQQLAAEGTRFENFFITTPICSPSRVSFLRGQYAHNHGVLQNDAPDGGFRRFRQRNIELWTIASWLQSAGYETALIGKFLNGYPRRGDRSFIPKGWTEWHAVFAGNYFDYRINENGRVAEYAGCCDGYETDVLATKAADFVRRSVERGAPFFLYLAPYAPHGPSTPAPRHSGAFAHAQAPRPPSFNEADVSDKPAQIAVRDPLGRGQVTQMDELFRSRLATMLAVEDMLDTLTATLESVGVLESTYILFTSDNGFHYGEHRLGPGKTTSYDEDIRVPLFIRGPGIAKGGVIDEIVLNIDVAPTLAELAGLPAPSALDGRSFVPLLRPTLPFAVDWRRGFLIERWNPGGSQQYFAATGYRALRTQDFLYVEWDTGEFELYDRRNDPFEMESIYSTTDPALRARFSIWLNRLAACTPGSCASTAEGL